MTHNQLTHNQLYVKLNLTIGKAYIWRDRKRPTSCEVTRNITLTVCKKGVFLIMKGFMRSAPKVCAKLLAMMFSPVLRLFVLAYQVIAGILFYALIGLFLVFLLGAGASFLNSGWCKEAVAYLALAGATLIVRWILIYLVSVFTKIKDAVAARAAAPIHSESLAPWDEADYYGDDWDNRYSNQYSYP